MLRKPVRALSSVMIIVVLVFTGFVSYSIFIPIKIFGKAFDELVFSEHLTLIALTTAFMLLYGIILRGLTGAYFYEYGSDIKQNILNGVYSFSAIIIPGASLLIYLYTMR